MHRALSIALTALALAGCSLPGPFRPFPEAPDWSGYNDQVYTNAFMLMAQQAIVTDLAGPEGWNRFLENMRVRVQGRDPEYLGNARLDVTPACTLEGLRRYIENPDPRCLMINFVANRGCNNRELCVSFLVPAEIARRASTRALITQMLSDPCAALIASGVTYPVFPDAMRSENAFADVFMRPPMAFKLFRCREDRRVYGHSVHVSEDGRFQLSFSLR